MTLGKEFIQTATMSTSQKMKDFTSEPMGEKVVKSLAGIGEKLGDKLIDEVNAILCQNSRLDFIII